MHPNWRMLDWGGILECLECLECLQRSCRLHESVFHACVNGSKVSSSRIVLLVGESLVLENLKNPVGSLSRMKFLEVLEGGMPLLQIAFLK